MNLSRPRRSYQESHPRRPERPLDQWLLTGRQLMNGVAGVRPRQRRIVSSESLSVELLLHSVVKIRVKLLSHLVESLSVHISCLGALHEARKS